MGRWLVILGLLAVQLPGLAFASPKSPEVPFWKRVLSVFTPATKPEPHRSSPLRASAATKPLEPITGSEIQSSPAKSTGAGTGCDAGRRIISAYYLQGHRTASGQPFDPNGMTAAHRTLPFGTQLTVTNPRTGKSVTVIVNDRGPFVSGVSLDLSRGAAQAIGMHGTGAVCIL